MLDLRLRLVWLAEWLGAARPQHLSMAFTGSLIKIKVIVLTYMLLHVAQIRMTLCQSVQLGVQMA